MSSRQYYAHHFFPKGGASIYFFFCELTFWAEVCVLWLITIFHGVGGRGREGGIRVALHQWCGSVMRVHAHAASSLTCPAMFLQGMLRHKL